MNEPSQTLKNFSFSDGQYLSHYSDRETCVMEYLNWQELRFRFIFSGIAFVRSFAGSASLCEATILNESELIDECRKVLAFDWASSGGPKGVELVELTIIDDVPLFSVVFNDVKIVGPLDDSDRLMPSL